MKQMERHNLDDPISAEEREPFGAAPQPCFSEDEKKRLLELVGILEKKELVRTALGDV
ncbi:MAG: hypothetical protein SCH70_04055 [Candidatus Methanoperedens sp.]|nr:hypothetical protein [Candidatus Methanoperedens sp.]